MSRADRVLESFPAFCRATERGKLLRRVVEALAAPLDDADTDLVRIQRSHRLDVADHHVDIQRLAALLGIGASYFEDILNDNDADYPQRLARMRRRVRRIAAVHLRGLGTPWAVVEAAAIFLEADLQPDPRDGRLLVPIDGSGLSHRVAIRFGEHVGRADDRIYLYENPIRRRKLEPADRWSGGAWNLDNRSVTSGPLRIAITGIGDRTVMPQIYCATNQSGILFRGSVPDGATLVLGDAGTTLDDRPVDPWVITFQGGVYSLADAEGSSLVVERGRPPSFIDHAYGTWPTGPRVSRQGALEVPPGISTWHFKVNEGRFDGDQFDQAVFATPREWPIGRWDDDLLQQAVYDYPPSARVSMRWGEHVAATFKLVLPARLAQRVLTDNGIAPSSNSSDALLPTVNAGSPTAPSLEHLERVRRILPRFKAAGIRGYVDAAREAWILGESVLRSTDADSGRGIDDRVTRLQNVRVDRRLTE